MQSSLESDVLLARDGDAAAFERLIETSANTVCSIALAIVRNVHASEDIAQETYLAAWSGLRNLRNPASFLPWLRQVTRNQARLWQREHLREVSNDEQLAGASDDRPSAVDSLIADEEEAILRDVLDSLNDEAREVLVLYYREGSSTAQVATLLGLSDAAVRQRLSRARSLVRDELLQRFGRAAARTAPGAGFAAALAGVLTAAAPASAAAVAAAEVTATGTLTTAALAKATLLGGALGWFGVFMGMQWLEPVFDEEEARQLRRFRNTLLFVVVAGCAAIAASAGSAMRLLIAVQSVYLVIALCYFLWLPRILKRRLEWERSVNPDLAAHSWKRGMWLMIRRALAATIGGAVIMALIVSGKLG